MRRFERFKWIPMLLKAYNEARERVQEHQFDDPPAGFPVIKPASGGSAPAETRSKSVKTAHKPVGKPKRKRSVRKLKRMAPPAGVRRVVRAHRMTGSDYKAVLQELREAKQQLGQLDSIRQQLDVMQHWFEERIPDAEKPSTSPSERGVTPRAPDADHPTYPSAMPPPPPLPGPGLGPGHGPPPEGS